MKLHFKSTYGKENNVIEFKSALEKTFEDGFDVLIFEEKRNGQKIIKNRIEFNENIVNIYSGVSTLEFELNKRIKNIFKTDVANVEVYIWTELQEIKIEENQVTIKYITSINETFDEVTNFLLELSWE